MALLHSTPSLRAGTARAAAPAAQPHAPAPALCRSAAAPAVAAGRTHAALGHRAGAALALSASRSSVFQGGAFTSSVSTSSNRRLVGCDRSAGLKVSANVFDGLSDGLNKAWKSLSGAKELTADNIKEPMKEIRRALLQADVSLPVVRRFVKKVSERAVGVDVVKGVTPEQMLVKVVNDELVQLMGAERSELVLKEKGTSVILMAGLQGVGKTTACGKLAMYLKKEGKSVMFAATDIYRPAAIDQLKKVGQKVGVDVFDMGLDTPPPVIAAEAVKIGREKGIDVVIVDTAGRLQVDDSLMSELQATQEAVQAEETLLVVDAMTGQEAATVVKTFNETVPLTGAILTKMDGDSRGGAALSCKEVSGKPIKFVGTGEKMEALEPFYPDRMASRILGMGDILTLVEKAEDSVKESDMEAMMKKVQEAKFDFNDFLEQMEMMNNMGTMGQMVKMLPGMSKISPKQMAEMENQQSEFRAMINSMTKEERTKPELLASSPSRRKRIARGAGRKEADVSNMIGQFTMMRSKMQNLSKMMGAGQMPGMAGVPTMSEDGMLSALERAASIPAGKVRRKKATVIKKKRKVAAAKGFGS